jgi:hypothetical protein
MLTEGVVSVGLGGTVVLYQVSDAFNPSNGPPRTEIPLASLALSASPYLSSDTDSVSDLEFIDFRADLDHLSNDFMTGYNEGSYPRSPTSSEGVVVLPVSLAVPVRPTISIHYRKHHRLQRRQ